MFFHSPHGAALYDEHHLALAARYPGTVTYRLNDMPNAGRVITSLRGDYPGVYSATGVTLQSAGPPLAGELVKTAYFAGANGNIAASGLDNWHKQKTSLTISAWFVGPSQVSGQSLPIVAGWAYAKNTSLGINNVSNKPTFSVTDSGNTTRNAIGPTAVNDSKPHHICGVFNGATTSITVYVDGVAGTPTTNAALTAVANTNDKFALGATAQDATLFCLKGSLAYATISPAAWSAADVYTTFKLGLHG